MLQSESSGSDQNKGGESQSPALHSLPTPNLNSISGTPDASTSRGNNSSTEGVSNDSSNKISGHTIVDAAIFTSKYDDTLEKMVKVNVRQSCQERA